MNHENTRRGGSAAPPRVPSRSELQKQGTEFAAQPAAISEVLRAEPMLTKDELIGSLAIGRGCIETFTEKEIDLVRDFAAETAIALEITRRERQLREVQTELAHANRVATMGQLTASIAHELKQPLAAARTDAGAALRWLDKTPPDLAEVRDALAGIVSATDRAGDVVNRIGALMRKAPPRKE